MYRGVYWVEGTTLFKLEKEASRMRMGGGSWTLNLDVLEKFPHVDKFEYRTHIATYRINRALAEEKGWEIGTMQDEQKLVVPIKWWDTTERRDNVRP